MYVYVFVVVSCMQATSALSPGTQTPSPIAPVSLTLFQTHFFATATFNIMKIHMMSMTFLFFYDSDSVTGLR